MPKPEGYLPPFNPPDNLTAVEAWQWIIRHMRAVMAEYLRIKDVNGRTIPLVLNNIQRKRFAEFCWEYFICKKPVRWIVLKSRRMGWSTLVAAIYYLLTKYQPGKRALVMAHDISATETLFGMHEIFESNIEREFGGTLLSIPRESAKTGKRLWWKDYDFERNEFVDKGGSRIEVKAAGSRAGKASDALNYVHYSEIGYDMPPDWTRATALTNQCVPNVPYTAIIQEGTANGVGNYLHRMWQGAVKGGSKFGWTPKFDPWWQFEQYRVWDEDIEIEPYGDTPEERDRDWQEIKALEQMMLQAWGWHDADPVTREKIEKRKDAALRWRQTVALPSPDKANGDINVLHSQYPSTWHEAFVSTGNNVFDASFISARMEECVSRDAEIERKRREARQNPAIIAPKFPKDVHTKNGPFLRIWHPPCESDKYIITADPAHGDRGGSRSAAIVWNWREKRVEAVWHSDTADVSEQAEDWADLGTQYATLGVPAEIAVEFNGPGDTVLRILEESIRYPNLYRHPKWDGTGVRIGFSTQTRKRKEAIAVLHSQLEYYTIEDIRIWEELAHFIFRKSGRAEAASGHHDDLVTCCWMFAYIAQERGEVIHPEWVAPEKPEKEQDDDGRFIEIKESSILSEDKVVSVRAVVESGRAFPALVMGNRRGRGYHRRDRRTLWMTKAP